MKTNTPKILIFDIETSPIISYTWGIWEQNVSLNQIKQDWNVLSYAAKWLGSKEIFYKDQRNAKDIHDDSKLLKGIWKLLDEADVVITQNGNHFDIKKLNARFVINGMQPPSSYKKIDTLQIAKKVFGFTSNKLEYMSDKLNKKYKKLTKRAEFSGFELWRECLNGNIKAWRQMAKYNKYDVLALEETYSRLIPWDKGVDFNLYRNDTKIVCSCGSTKFKKNGPVYTDTSKFHRYKCLECGKEMRGRTNLFSKEKRASLRAGVSR